MKPDTGIFADIQVLGIEVTDVARAVARRDKCSREPRSEPAPSRRCRTLLASLALVAGFLVLGEQAWGTVIVALRTETELVIGADSKVTMDHSSGVPLGTTNVSKIGVIADRLFFAGTGVLGDSRGFMIYELIPRVYRTGQTPLQLTTAGAEAIAETLAPILKDEQGQVDRLYEGMVGEKFVTLLVFGFNEDGVPSMHARDFNMLGNPFRLVLRPPLDCPPRCPVGPFQILTSGDGAVAVDRLLRELGADFNKGVAVHGLAAGVRVLIERAIQEMPAICGPPIEIVRLTSAGPECAE